MAIGRVRDNASLGPNPDFLVCVCWDEEQLDYLSVIIGFPPPFMRSAWSDVVKW